MTAWILFAAVALLILYILAGYPLLLAYAARGSARPVSRAPFSPGISALIPVHNGELFLAAKLQSILDLDYPVDLLEVFVISDGSTDRTAEIARSFAPRVRLIEEPRGGKPAALNAGLAAASREILLLTDARQVLRPDSVRLLMENFADPSVGAASGTLLIRRGGKEDETDVGLYWRFESWMRRKLSAVDSMFGATGPFYAMRRELAVRIPPETLLDDMYLPLAAFRRGFRLVVDERAIARDFPTSREVEFRRKVRTLAGNYQLLKFYPWLLGFGNRMWLHFVSYKVGRLLLPYLLIAAAIISFFLPAPFKWLALVGQAAFYALAALDPVLPSGSPIRKITSPFCTFVVMMAAAILGVSVFFRPPQSLWKVTTSVSAGKEA